MLATASNLFMQSDERKIFTNVSPHLGIGDVAEISAVLWYGGRPLGLDFAKSHQVFCQSSRRRVQIFPVYRA